VSYPRQAAQPIAGGTAGLVAQVALATAVAGFVMGLLGTSVGSSTGNLTAGILIRGVLSLVVVLLICRALGGRAKQAGIARPVLVVVVGALIGFALDPLTWEGRTALTQLATDPGALTLIGDLVLWLLAAGAGGYLGARSAAGPAPAETPYG
jgi:hypothetical protein